MTEGETTAGKPPKPLSGGEFDAVRGAAMKGAVETFEAVLKRHGRSPFVLAAAVEGVLAAAALQIWANRADPKARRGPLTRSFQRLAGEAMQQVSRP